VRLEDGDIKNLVKNQELDDVFSFWREWSCHEINLLDLFDS